MMRVGLAIAVLAAVSACAPATSSSSPRTPSPSPHGFLVLLLRPNAPAASSKVEIVDLSGKVVASADFTALPGPASPGGCGPITPPMVRVAAGAAFFVDSSGVVNRLDPNGTHTPVATLKLTTSQAIVSFAISPDGTQVIAIVISATAGGPATLDLEEATAGGPTTVAFHKVISGQGATEITGWDAAGPTATLSSLLCVQQAPPSLEYTGTSLVHLALDGTHLDQIGGTGCLPWDELVDGSVLCGSPQWDSFTVRSRTGSVLWGRQESLYNEPRLSPDGHAVAFNADGQTATVLTATSSRPASSTRLSLPRYAFLGWAGNSQIVVVRNDGHLGLQAATGPMLFDDLGLLVGDPCVGCGSQRVFLAGTIGIS
jgi:hypothetical protein